MIAHDTQWGEPVWSDTAPADPPSPAVDWRKSIPREFVARTSPASRPGAPAPVASARPAGSWSGESGESRSPAGPSTRPQGAPAPPEGAVTPPHAVRPPSGARPPGTGESPRPLGVNGVNGTQNGRELDTGGDDRDPAPAHSRAGSRASRSDEELGHGPDDTAPWNELDREIARALAATLAGKLSRYVTGPILPLVADELARLLGTRAGEATRAAEEARTGEGPDAHPRHLGAKTPPDPAQ